MQQASSAPPTSSTFRRRDLLAGTGAVAFLAGLGISIDALLAQSAVAAPSAEFEHVSRFVTDASLSDKAEMKRAWSQMVALDRQFPDAVRRLSRAIKDAGMTTMSQFLASPLAKDEALFATAKAITATWYLGHSGGPATATTKDTSGFVTFTGAIMWRPTIDATVIPTYSRGQTDFWVQAPAGTPAPRGAVSVPEWRASKSSSKSPQKA
jgi:hypothetical protein